MKALRINRYLSQAGLGSRRHVEELLRAGRIKLNGQTVRDLATRVNPQHDRVELDGRILRAHLLGRVLAYHKPVNVVCSFRRQGSHPCLLDVLPAESLRGRLFHLGRLDRDSSGLLLLSDDGELGNALMHPSQPVWKRYRVVLDDELDPEARRVFRAGILELDGKALLPARLRSLKSARHAVYQVQLREGRRRQIRRMMRALGRRVLDLRREAIGPVELGELAVGELREVSGSELRRLRQAAGLAPH